MAITVLNTEGPERRTAAPRECSIMHHYILVFAAVDTCIQYLSCGCLALGWLYWLGSVERGALARVSDSLLLLKRGPFLVGQGSIRDMLFVVSTQGHGHAWIFLNFAQNGSTAR